MFGNIGKMMKLVSELKTRLPEMQEKLAATPYTASVNGGTVAATVNGKLQLIALRIAPSLLETRPADPAMLEDLILAAVIAAQKQAADAAQAAMAELTGGVDLPPGLF